MSFRKVIVVAAILGASFQAQAENLTDALQSGLMKSDQLEASRQNFIAARQALITSNSANDLTGTASVTGSHTESDKKQAGGGFASSQSLSASINISKQIYDSGEGEARQLAAKYTLDRQRANYRAQEQQIILAIIDSYLSLLTSVEARILQEENVARLQAQTDATKIRLDAGTTTATRLAEAGARLARAKSNLIAAQANEETARETYLSLTGLNGRDLSLPSLPESTPASLSDAEAMALDNHPDIAAALAGERSARVQFDVLSRQVKPKLNLSLSATDQQQKGTMQDKLDIKGQLVFSTPILVTPSSRAKGKEVSAMIERAKYQLADARRVVALNARSAFRQLRSAKAQRHAVEAELAAAELVADGIKTEVEFGQKIFLDQLDAEQSVSDAKVRLLQADQSIMLNSYRLLASLGGLTLDDVGLAGQFDSLDALQDPADVFQGFLPRAELPQ